MSGGMEGRFQKLARMVILLLRSFRVDAPSTSVGSVAAAAGHQEAGARRKIRQQMSLSELANPETRQAISERVQQRLHSEMRSSSTANRLEGEKLTVSEEVRTILTNSSWNRSHSEVERAAAELSPCIAFSDYSSSIQRSLCKVGWYQRVEPGRVIVKERQLPCCFYFILSGTVRVQRRGSERNELVEAGQTFGDMEILKHVPREASFVAKSDTELLVISKSDYIDLSLRQCSKSFQSNKHFAFCQSINLLRYWPLYLLKSQPESCKVEKFTPNTVVVKDSQKSGWVYVVMVGSCRVVKRFVDSTETVGRRQPVQSYPASDLRPSRLALTGGRNSLKTGGKVASGAGGSNTPQLQDELVSPRRSKAIRQSRSLGSLQSRSKEQQLGSPHPAVNKQFLVQLQILQPKDIFGLSTVLHQDEPSVTLVSNGAELVLISKEFIMEHLSNELRMKLQRQVVQFPSEEAMRKRIRDHYAWNLYKQTMTNQMKKHIS